MVCIFTALFSSVNFTDDRGTPTEGHRGVTKSGHAVTFGAWCFSHWTLPGGGSDLCGKLTQPKHSSGPGASLEMNVTDDTQQTGTPLGVSGPSGKCLSLVPRIKLSLCVVKIWFPHSVFHTVCLFSSLLITPCALARTTGQEL